VVPPELEGLQVLEHLVVSRNPREPLVALKDLEISTELLVWEAMQV
jgi:hypothetical protein